MKFLRLAVVVLLVGVSPVVMANSSVGDVTVRAERNGQLVTDLTQSGATLVTQVQYVGLESWTKSLVTNIHFMGTGAVPATSVLVMIPDLHLSQSVDVAENGEWSVDVPTTQFKNGNYYAYVATAEGDSVANMEPVAYFTVSADEAWSPATWIFISTGVISILALFIAITVQLNYNTKHHPVV